VISVRPKIAELVFQLYGRPLHPELFDVYQSRVIQRGDYEATIEITSAGHVVSWRRGARGSRDQIMLTEVATAAHHPLPEKRRLMNYRLQGERHDSLEVRGVRYHVSFQLETVHPDLFWTFQNELCGETTETKGMLHRFDSSGRIALGAMSYVNIESRSRSLLVQAFHTFPDDYALVKSQSLFEIG